MKVTELWLHNFRSYSEAQLELAPGLTAVVGANGAGKTNLLEAVAWMATLGSFRGAPTDALIRQGADAAVVRAMAEREGRGLLIETELPRVGRNRVQVNRQPMRRARDLIGALRVSVFTPDDLAIIKGGPAERRRFVDDALVSCHPKLDAVRTEVERVLRQRNTLLKQAGGRLDEAAELTLDVWDSKLTEAGDALVQARSEMLESLGPVVSAMYTALSGHQVQAELTYQPSWDPEAVGLADALNEARRTDLRRGVTTVGPHRDEILVTLDGLPTRTHGSQGEQRTTVLALKLAVHQNVADAAGSPPVLLLDDIFSELDDGRSAALLEQLPPGQVLLTTASDLPPGAAPEATLTIEDGKLVPS